MMGFIPVKYRHLGIPLFVIVIVLTLSLTAGRVMFERITETKNNISGLEENNKLLEAKKDILSTLGQADLKGEAEAALNAVPGENSSLLSMSSIRGLAARRNLSILDARVEDKSNKNEKSVNLVDINISIQGNISNVVLFLNDIKKTAPLTKITQANISLRNNNANLSLTLTSIWSPLPTQLGKIEQPIEDLRSADRGIAAKLKELQKPTEASFNLLAPQGRDNPFVY